MIKLTLETVFMDNLRHLRTLAQELSKTISPMEMVVSEMETAWEELEDIDALVEIEGSSAELKDRFVQAVDELYHIVSASSDMLHTYYSDVPTDENPETFLVAIYNSLAISCILAMQYNTLT